MKKKAKIYIPSKTAMQSGLGKRKNWILEFETRDPKTNALMGWESSDDTLGEVKLEFSSKEKAIDFANKNSIKFSIIEPNKKNFVIKSYAYDLITKFFLLGSIIENLILFLLAKSMAFSFEENSNFTSPSVSSEDSQPISAFVLGSLVSNSNIQFFLLPNPDCIAVFEGI